MPVLYEKCKTPAENECFKTVWKYRRFAPDGKRFEDRINSECQCFSEGLAFLEAFF